jgi:hypothetical protein
MKQIGNAMAAAQGLRQGYNVVAVCVVHGESDHDYRNGPYYAGYLREWQHDYDTDAKSITGQTNDVPMFLCQMSSYTFLNSATSLIPSAQLYATENFMNLFLVGPKYFLSYSDGLHLTAASYRQLGEYYGKALQKVLVSGERWRPLTPDTIAIIGRNIAVKFHVPAPPIVIDTTAVLEKNNYGFEYADDSSSASISGVTITGPETLVIALDKVPTGPNPRLRYAFTGTPGSWAGANQPGSARGNIRDSDTTPSLYGSSLANWLVHFDYAIPFDAAHPLRIDAIWFGPQRQALISFRTVAGAEYLLDGATDLTSPINWCNLYSIHGSELSSTNLDSISATAIYTNTTGLPSCFFRIRAQ